MFLYTFYFQLDMLWSVLVSWRKVYGKWLISFECIGCIDLLVLRRNRYVGLWSVTSWRISVAWPLVPESLWCLPSAHWLQDSQASCPWDHTTMSWILQFIPACRPWAEISDFSSSETWTWGSPSLSSEFMTSPWLSQQTPGTVFLRSLIEHLRLLQRSHLS